MTNFTEVTDFTEVNDFNEVTIFTEVINFTEVTIKCLNLNKVSLNWMFLLYKKF